MNNQDLDIREGTISFWIHPNNVDYQSNTTIPLVQVDPPNGSIFILKDSDNKLKFFHIYIGKGRTDAEIDVSKLKKDQKHFFVFTWSIKKSEIVIFVDDDKIKVSNKILY